MKFMQDYYNIRQLYGNYPVQHGLRSHPTILEWLYRLHTKYDKLDDEEILNYEIEIANWIQGDMHWEKVYKTIYDPHTKCLTVTGFPKYGYPDYFQVNEAQLEFLLHRIRYNKATIYYQHRSVVKIVLCITSDWDLKTKKILKEQMGNEDPSNPDCNILTPHNPRPWHGDKKCP